MESYIFEGKTTNEAIEKGLKELNVSRNKVDIKVLESEEKRSFFSILTPRVVKVEITLKEVEQKANNNNVTEIRNHKENKVEKVEFDSAEVEKKVRNFLDEFFKKLPNKEFNYKVEIKENDVYVDVTGENTGFLIGYRGEVLNSLQTILSNIVSRDINGKIKVLLNISGYREKREKDLQNLATKIAGSVVKTKRSITLEPMSAYERKVIHLKLQNNSKVQTHSIGEEPYRKIVVSLKK